MNQPNLFTGSDNLLYCFSPRKFGMQSRNPMRYAFNDRFINGVEEIAAEGILKSNRVINDLVFSPQGHGLILPSTDLSSGPIRMDVLSDYWTFLLLINNDKPRRVPIHGNTESIVDQLSLRSPLESNRAIYFGFFLDEPISRLSMHMPNPSLNLNATLYITHRTVIRQNDAYGFHGHVKPGFHVIDNNDFINPGLLFHIATDNEKGHYQLSPDKIVSGFELVPENQHQYTHASFAEYETSVNPHAAPFGIKYQHSEPKEHMKNLLTGIANAGDVINAGSKMDIASPLDFYMDSTQGSEIFQQNIASRFRFDNALDNLGLNCMEPVNLDMIVKHYDPNIQPIIIEPQHYHDVVDQTNGSRSNAYSSMIIQAGSYLLQAAGLSNITITYNSWNEALQVHDFGFMASMDSVNQEGHVRAFLTEFKRRILDMIKVMAGEFNVNLDLQSSAVSKIVLNFLDDDQHISEPFEIASIAGGLNSNMIGSHDDMISNTHSMEGLINSLTGIVNNDPDLASGMLPLKPLGG